MQTLPISKFLRIVFLADAATCIATGVLMTLGGGLLAGLSGLPIELLLYAGVGLFPFAALLIYLATRITVSPVAVRIVIVLNALWTLDSFLILLTGWIQPNAFGYAFVVFQAIGVAGFAALEYIGLRRMTAEAQA